MNSANLKYLLVYVISILLTSNNLFFICTQDNGKYELKSSLIACSELECNENEFDSSVRITVKCCRDNEIIFEQLTNDKETKQVIIQSGNVIQFNGDKLDTKYFTRYSSINFHKNISKKIIETTILLI